MSISIQERSDTVALIVGMFDAAPGQVYLSTFIDFLEQEGATRKQLASNLAESDVFKGLYPTELTDGEFTTQFIEKLVGPSVSAGDKAWAAGWMLNNITLGASRGDAIYDAIEVLLSIDLSTPVWGAVASNLLEKSTYAEYYSVVQGNSSNTLQELTAAIYPLESETAVMNLTVDHLTPGEMSPGNDEFGGTHNDDVINGTENGENLNGFDGNDTINGNGGADWITPGAGNDTITALAGTYTSLSYRGLDSAVHVDMVGGTTAAEGKADIFSNISYVEGTDFNDEIIGGNPMHDEWEMYVGGRGDDQMHGGEGYDELGYHNDYGSSVSVNFATGTATDAYDDTDTFSGMEAVRGTRLADSFYGNSEQAFISYRGLAGNDYLEGTEYDSVAGTGWDRADYSRDDRYLDVNGNYGASGIQVDLASGTATDGYDDTDTLINIDQIRGTSYDDHIYGNDLYNKLEGKDGNDTLNGRGGDDTLKGGGGSDIFLFEAAWGLDTVTDFESGSDVLDFSAAFLAYSDLTVSSTDGNLVIADQGGNSVTLTGIGAVSESDFYFG